MLYASADEHIVSQIISEFEKSTGIHVLVVGDTEAKKTTGLIERIIAEKEHPQADVFWSSEIFMTISLASQGLLVEHDSDSLKDWPTAFRDANRMWYGFAARARVIVYSPSRVPADQVPKSWMDLTHDAFKDRLVLADPRFGTTGGHLGAMLAYWDSRVMPGYYDAFMEGMAANHARLLPSGNAGVVDAVARGEADVGMTDTDDVWAAQAQGLDVQLVYPLHNIVVGEKGAGTLLIPNTVARIRNGPHPELAKRLMDFLLSEKVERMLAQSESHNLPIRSGLAASYASYAVPDPLAIDYSAAAGMRPQAVRTAIRMLSSLTPPAIRMPATAGEPASSAAATVPAGVGVPDAR